MYSGGSRHTLEPPGGDCCRAPDRQRGMQALLGAVSDASFVVFQLIEPGWPGTSGSGSSLQASWTNVHMLRHAQRAAARQLVSVQCTAVECHVACPSRTPAGSRHQKGVEEPQLSILPLPEFPLHCACSGRLSQLDAVKPSLMAPPSARLLLIGVSLLIAVHAVSGAAGLGGCCFTRRPSGRGP